jgi:hemerythrin-like domain-containing protein
MTEPDLTGLTVVHQAIRGDLRRLAALGCGPVPPGRADALATYVTELCAQIHQHHAREDEVAWPVIAAAAGAAVDLAPLSDDHSMLDPLLTRLSAAAEALRRDPRIDEIVHTAARMSALFDEHIADKENVLFPVIREYVTETEWLDVQRRMAKGIPLAHVRWQIPWLRRWAEPGQAGFAGQAPVLAKVILRLSRNRFAELERRVFHR